ncbi:DUF1033 family protein, partial [Streptococcus uberis]
KRWCEDCGDDLQQFHSILLLKDRDIIPSDQYVIAFEQRNVIPQQHLICVN